MTQTVHFKIFDFLHFKIFDFLHFRFLRMSSNSKIVSYQLLINTFRTCVEFAVFFLNEPDLISGLPLFDSSIFRKVSQTICIIGTQNAAVLPLPVSAAIKTSPPPKIAGIASA